MAPIATRTTWRTGQYLKQRHTDPYGTPLPPGVCWFAGVDPGYAVEVQCWSRSISLTVPYRLYPDTDGIRVALALKATLVHIRETVPVDCIERFAGAVVGTRGAGGGGCGVGGGVWGRGRVRVQ